jgi:RecJ-like exonuclease
MRTKCNVCNGTGKYGKGTCFLCEGVGEINKFKFSIEFKPCVEYVKHDAEILINFDDIEHKQYVINTFPEGKDQGSTQANIRAKERADQFCIGLMKEITEFVKGKMLTYKEAKE